MPGKLVNTNEILVLLGDNWFVERSAKQACDMISRRLAGLEENLNDLEAKKKRFQNDSEYTDALMQVGQRVLAVKFSIIKLGVMVGCLVTL